VIGTGVSSALAAKPKPRPEPRPPAPAKAKTYPVEIVWQNERDEPMRIEIPAEAMRANGNAGAAKRSIPATIIGGVALSLAFIFGGLWLVRRNQGQPTQRFVKAGAVMVCLAVVGGIAWQAAQANVAPPDRPFPRPPQPPKVGAFHAELVVTPQGKRIRLHLSRTRAEDILGRVKDQAPPK